MALSPNHRNWCNSEVEAKDLCQDKTRMEFDFLALNGERLWHCGCATVFWLAQTNSHFCIDIPFCNISFILTPFSSEVTEKICLRLCAPQ